jgi:hypothetical protein
LRHRASSFVVYNLAGAASLFASTACTACSVVFRSVTVVFSAIVVPLFVGFGRNTSLRW